MDEITTEITKKIKDRLRLGPLVVGISGLDCSGKTTFAKGLSEHLTRQNIHHALLHIDDYNNLVVQKQVYDAHGAGALTGELQELYYRDSIDYGRAATAIMTSREACAVTIIEGVFLFKERLAPLLDIRIFLPVAPKVARMRYEKRKLSVSDLRPITVFDDIWLLAFERYIREVQPEEKSDFTSR